MSLAAASPVGLLNSARSYPRGTAAATKINDHRHEAGPNDDDPNPFRLPSQKLTPLGARRSGTYRPAIHAERGDQVASALRLLCGKQRGHPEGLPSTPAQRLRKGDGADLGRLEFHKRRAIELAIGVLSQQDGQRSTSSTNTLHHIANYLSWSERERAGAGGRERAGGSGRGATEIPRRTHNQV